MELLAGLFSAWILSLHLNKTNSGFVSVQIANKLKPHLALRLATQSSDFSLLFCFSLKCFTIMRIPIAALPGANERIIPAEDVLLKVRSSCLTAAFNEIAILS